MLNKEEKDQIIKDFAITKNDTGSYDVQIAILSKRIKQVSEHLKSFPKDNHSKLGLLKMVGKRKSFYNHYKKSEHSSYLNLMKKLKEKNYI